tara:strand:- start:26035 stop:26679 length:645 start_codon:yes stop_codon:yes gene_type:complete
MKYTYFDIETGPLPDAELLQMIKPFDASEVKLGNIKDPDKIAAKIHEREINHFADARDKAALSPLTGRVLAIGLLTGLDEDCLDSSEASILENFWRRFRNSTNYFIGFNSNTFDLPFLIKRSWKHNVLVPLSVRDGRYWSKRFIDLRDTWQLGDRQASGSLDRICCHFGLEGKNGNGKDFARLFELDKELALDYLRNDLRMTREVAERMNGVGE